MADAAITRRAALGALGALGAGSLLSRGSACAAELQPCAPSAWTKHGVIARHTGEPAGGWLQNFTSPAEPLDGDRWRLWCSVSGRTQPKNIGIWEGVPGETMRVQYAVLSSSAPPRDAPLAIGNLPAGWRPVQVVHVNLPDGPQRIYFWAHAEGVVRYLAADSADGRRFTVLDPLRPCLVHPADRTVDGAAAVEAGLTRRAKLQARPVAGEPLATADIISNDATNVYQLPDGSWEMYSVALVEVPKGDPRYIAHDNVAGSVRVIDRYTSDNGLQWTDRRRVIVPDERDPADQQFYYLSVTHTPRGRVGLLGHYRVGDQTIDLEWCFSADGIAWQRPHRRAWLPRGDAQQLDSTMLHAPHAMVQHEGKWWLFYTGGNFTHNHRHAHGGAADRAVCLATCDDIWQE